MSTATTSSPNWLHRLDVTGSALSTLCAIHCLAMPLVAAALPLWGLSVLGSRGWERFTCSAMVALAAFCLWQGCRRHGRWWLLAVLGLGATVVLGTQFFWADADCEKACCAVRTDWLEAAFMFAGGLTIAAAHVLNLHYRRKCTCRFCPGTTATAAKSQNNPASILEVKS